ncbi:MAG: O-antigen ligase family protein, partial [Planctomycetaceae bacterium]
WTIPLERGGLPFAAFVNRNNACGFLNLTLAAGIGFFICSISGRHKNGSDQDFDRPQLPLTLRNLLGRMSDMHASQQLGLVAIILILAGIVCSTSRAGIAATVSASIVTVILFRRRTRDNVVVPLSILLLVSAVFLVIWAGLSGQIGERLSTLLDERILQDGRFTHWKDSIRSVADHWWLGTGLGTYRYAYQPYELANTGLWHYNADNQYLEWLVEWGLLGLSIVVAAILLFVFCIRQLLTSKDLTHHAGLAYVGIFLLLSQGLHAGFDFGVSVTSNMLLLALMIGVISGQAASLSHATGRSHLLALPSIRSPIATATIALFLFLNCLINLPEILLCARARAALNHLPNLQHSSPHNLDTIDHAILSMNRVVRDRPDDAELNYWLGELWAYRYRLQTLPILTDLSSSVQSLRSGPHWPLTRLSVIHAHANALQSSNDGKALQALRTDPLIQDHLQIAAGYFRLAQTACPLLPHVDFRLAELAFLHNNQPVTGASQIRRSVCISPSRADIQFAGGLLALNAGLQRLSCQCWRQSWRLSQRFRPTIMRESLDELSMTTVAKHIIPDEPRLLIDAAQNHFVGSDFKPARSILADRAVTLLNQHRSDRSTAEDLFLRGQCHAIHNAPQQAVDSMRRALTIEPLNGSWRFDLAQYLESPKQFTVALQEARICVALSPDNQQYMDLERKLLRRILREPQVRGPSITSPSTP